MDIHLYKQANSKFWWMQYTENGKVIRKSTKCAKKPDAKDFVDLEMKKWKARIGIGVRDTITLKDLIQEVEKDYNLNGRKSEDRLKYSKKHLVRIIGEETRIEAITEKTVDDYKHARKDEGCANGTLNRELALLRRGFNLLRLQKRTTGAPRITLLKEDNPRQGFIEVWEYREILKHLPVYLQPLITFLYKTGWRKSEAMNMIWNMVDLTRKEVRLPQGYTKNNRPRIFPFDDELEGLFNRLWNEKEQTKPALPYVFLNKQMTDRVVDFRGSWDTACEDAVVGKRLIHDMRRSAVRNMVEAGVNEKVAMELSGHLTRSVFENYHIVSTDDLRNAVQKVSAATAKAKKPQEKEKEGIIPGVPFRSAEHGGDFIELHKGDKIFPDEIVHYRKPTEKEWRTYLDYAAGEFGVDFIRELAEQPERDKKSKMYLRLAREKLESLEKEKGK